MENLVDEIRQLSAKLSEFKQLYYVQTREREMAGEKYIALQDDFDKNKHVHVILLHNLAAMPIYSMHRVTVA